MKYTVELTEAQADALTELGYDVKRTDVEAVFEKEWPYMKCQFWYIGARGAVDWLLWNDTEGDHRMLSIGNCFRTEEDALFEIERREVIHELKQFADDAIEWDSQNVHYCIYYVKEDGGKLDIDYNVLDKHAEIYFATLKDAQKAIEAVGEDRIRKYYLRVKE